MNYYTRQVCGPAGERLLQVRADVRMPGEHTAMGWEVYPEGLYELLLRLHPELPAPSCYVTENGAAFEDAWPAQATSRGGATAVEAYLRAHFAAAHEAIEAGVPLQGYFVWSLMDNFEWSHG